MTTWILTGSPDNFAATREHDFRIIGLKERNRNRALEIEPGDRIVFWLTQAQRFAGSVRVTGELFEDREKIWPGKPGKVDPYPWRFATEPEIVLEDGDHVPGEELAPRLSHVQKWPAEHWRLAFQGQIRAVGERDAELLVEALQARAGARS
jgi:predicted RNA-binding protein